MAPNRKNALFAGHDEGAENWACVASLIETCKLNDVDLPTPWDTKTAYEQAPKRQIPPSP
jgi:hypothetical protein